MATVYAATHRNSKRFAVKMLHPELSLRADLRARFLREGYVANQVQHGGAVAVLDDDVAEDGSAFLVMELLEGATAEEVWEQHGQRLPLDAVLAIGDQVLEVLASAHERGIVHRDIKPANLFLTSEGQLKVLDFGIARLRDAASSAATHTGMVMGTPAFMSPEQALANPSDIDAQSDVWAVGAVLFTLLSGRLVHEAANAQQILIRVATTPAPSLDRVVPGVRKEIVRLIDLALVFDKTERWKTAVAMRLALRTTAQEVIGGNPSRHCLDALLKSRSPGHVPAALAEATSRRAGQRGVEPTQNDPVPTVQVTEAWITQPSPAGGAARLVGLTTAEPVSQDSSRASPRRRRSVVLVTAGIAVASIAIIAMAILVNGRRTNRGEMNVPTAGSAPTVATTATATPPDTKPLDSGSSSIPVEQLPQVPMPGTSKPSLNTSPVQSVAPAATSAIPAPRPSPKPNCNPPYDFDSQGNKRWKVQCL